MIARRADLLCIGLLLGLAGALFADVLFLGSNFALFDLFLYHFPMKSVVHELIARGQFPWWNPFLNGGQPMAANPAYEIFYPPQYLIFVGSYQFGFALHIVFHIGLALAGMFLFLREIPLRRSAAIFGAVSFGLGGFFLASAATLPTFFVWSWAGLGGWSVLRWLRGGSFALAAAVMSMPMLIGEPVALAQFWLLVIAGAWREWKRIALLAIAAAGIAAVQLVPMIDHFGDTVRSRGLTYADVVDFSMPPQRPLELIAPNVFVHMDPEHPQWNSRIFVPRGMPYLLSIYCGLGVAILAAAGVARRTPGAARAAAIAAVAYVLALGGHTPLFRFLYAIGLRSVRYPEKLIVMGLAGLVIFAAVAFDRLDLRGARLGAAAAAIVAVVAIVAGRFWTVAALAAAWALLLAFHRDTRAWRLAALALLLIDLGSFSRQAIPRTPRSYFTPPPIVATLDRDRDAYAVFHRGAWIQPQRVELLHFVAPLSVQRSALYPDSPIAWGFRLALAIDYDETDLLPTHDLLDAMKRLGDSGYAHWSEPFAWISNVRYVIDYRADSTIDEPIRVTRIPNQGRYWFARRLSRNFVQPGTAIVRTPFVPAPAHIAGLRETASSAALDVDASGAAFLVITITRHKYWRATIDGREAPLVAANIAYQGLVVPAGRHHVELRYRNPLVGWGAGVSGLALVAAVIVPTIRRRQAPENQKIRKPNSE